ncbi:ataxin-1-like [Bufo bufo]|uniref:ataxin-1-like n=1 Tax=Bufo bufo TaxID=8384 RepID=UPI001ABE1548|nr:ataxin-1-like [Bufo bufo]XP_040264975.1 ataxin-1-like [Bufo bufo]XP_040264976.1 ataxin-1-like [Bufo bufo]
MKPAYERSQECLPPKKRDLAQSTINIEQQAPKVNNSSSSESSANETPNWPRGVLVASGQGHGVRYEVAGDGAEAVTVDQYGNMYKIAVPPTFSPQGLHSVVNMGSIPPSFNVASPLIQHPGITYPPIHYAPISHTSVQFLGSPYAVPYTVPPGFLQRAVISPPATLATSHVPHYVPYNSILTEGVTPPPQPPSPQAYSKVTTAQSPSVLMGMVPVDITKGRVPVFYQHSSQIPAGYPVHEMILACPPPPNAEHNPSSPSDKLTLMTSTNGSQRGSECASSRRGSQAVEQYIHNSDEEMVRGQSDNLLDCDTYSGHATQRSEVALMTHRSTPDTDLEVQRVVGGMASQEYCAPSVQRKERMSPLNLSNDVKHNSKRSNSNLTSPPRADLRGAYSVQHPHKYTDNNALISNGESARGTLSSAERFSTAAPQHASKETRSPEVRGRGRDSPPAGPPLPPHSTTLPSHFMKGAIIQLATGELKRVEDLQTQDFVRSAEVSGGLKIDSSTVVDIQESQWPGFVTLHFVVGEQQSKVCLDVPPEHPFFVYGQGWSSCSPSQTAQLFALPCHRLQVGDVCISISLQSISKNGASPAAGASTHQALPHPIEKAVLQSRECPAVSERDGDKQHPLQRDGLAQSSLAQAPCPLPAAPSSWSSPVVQRYSGQSTEARPSPSRHSFIPQEVKLSIEGRSNAGK